MIMASDGIWIFVDDRVEEATVFAEVLSSTGLIKVEVISPQDARIELLQKGREPAGVLMDVDLSSIQGEFGTGPGIAQDIRTKQKSGSTPEFPVIRFSAAEPLNRNVVGDPSSDDLFELAILKDDLKTHHEKFATQLVGVRGVYDFFTDRTTEWNRGDERLSVLFGISHEKLGEWTHEGLRAKILTGVTHAPHVAAGVFCRLFLIPAGLLIDCELLAVRLGVDISESGDSWNHLIKLLTSVAYTGVAGGQFARWWARGVDDWWYDAIDKSGPLSGKTVAERVALIRNVTGLDGLKEIEAIAGQTEMRFWRFCRLAMENRPTERIPVDPSDSVRLISQVDLPNWVEPWCASARLAFREQHDPRMNQKDLDRLRRKYKV
jgi:CheY-like chemotaxis protein